MGSKNGQETIIAQGVRVEGDFKSQGFVLVDGEVIGNLETESDLAVGESAHISANVAAVNARIAGEVRGNVLIKERLDLAKTARVHGDVMTKILAVEAGAVINGKCVMGEEANRGSLKKEMEKEEE